MKIKYGEILKRAVRTLKHHYLLLTFTCLLATVLGTQYTDALNFTTVSETDTETVDEVVSDEIKEAKNTDGATVSEVVSKAATSSTVRYFGLDGIYNAMVNDQIDAYKENAQETATEKDKSYGLLNVGHSRGALAALVNSVSSGTLYLIIYSAIRSAFVSKNVGIAIVIILAVLVYIRFWMFYTNVYEVIMARIVLEARVYKKVPAQRFIFLLRIKRWTKVALSLLRYAIYQTLWYLTIIGGFIKRYSYFCVPYIIAENPDVSGKKAIDMSRKMMNGCKFKCFLLDMIFLPLDLICFCTGGFAGLLLIYPFKTAAYAEFYAECRKNYIEKTGECYELLDDRYLFEKPDQDLLNRTYSDIEALKAMPQESFPEGHKFARFMAVNFGVILKHNEVEKKILKSKSIKIRIKMFSEILKGHMYPGRLSPIPEKEKEANLEGLGYMRCYTVVSIILIFFTMCFIGWGWEVGLHLITDHAFVKRGVLHGPWLPIYGAGGVLIMLFMNRFRQKPAWHFIGGMALAGVVEYYTSWQLEITFNGAKWWDYSGYFLNLNGRICAEGLLVFGLGGMVMVYVVAPLLDNMFRKIPNKTAITICAVLVAAFLCDQAYSAFHPNMGAGITDYTSQSETVLITSTDTDWPLLAEGEIDK